MRIDIVNLTKENLSDAPEWDSHPFSCKYCIYWEFPDEYGDSVKGKRSYLLQKKTLWLQDTKRIFGDCGKLMYLNGEPIGYAQYAPPEFLPRSSYYHSDPPDYDAVLISCLFIPRNEFRGKGFGSQLLENILVELRKRGIKTVETFARKGNPDNPSGPEGFYVKNSFVTKKVDLEFSLMRLEF